jgi:hypothetical protein
MRIKFTSLDIKYIAIIAMLIDHIAWKLPLAKPFAVILHIIGRIAMPIFCYQIAEGFHYTRNKKIYAERLFIFAVIS